MWCKLLFTWLLLLSRNSRILPINQADWCWTGVREEVLIARLAEYLKPLDETMLKRCSWLFFMSEVKLEIQVIKFCLATKNYLRSYMLHWAETSGWLDEAFSTRHTWCHSAKTRRLNAANKLSALHVLMLTEKKKKVETDWQLIVSILLLSQWQCPCLCFIVRSTIESC